MTVLSFKTPPHVHDMIFLFFSILWDYLRLLHFTRTSFGRVVAYSGAKNRSASSDWRKLCSPRNQNFQLCHVRRVRSCQSSPLHFSAERSERNLCSVGHLSAPSHLFPFILFSFSVHRHCNPFNKPLHRWHQDRTRTRT